MKKNINLIFFGIVLTLITGCSLRFPIYIAAPLICCLLYFIYEKGLKKEYIKLFITIGIATVIGLMINKYINNALSILESIDRGLLNSKEELLTGLFNVIYNYFWLCGATNLNVYSLTVHYTNDFISSSSPLIVISFIRVIYAVVTFMLPFILFPKFNKFEEKEKYVFIYVISLKFLLLFFLLFCDMNYWYRYITPILIFENLLYPLLYKYYFSKTNKNKIVFSLAIIGFVFTSLFFVMTSTFDVKKKDFRDNKYQSVADILLKNDLHFGYTLDSNEHNIYSLLTNGNLQIIRINDTGTGPLNWLNSTEWFEEDYHKGRTFFIRKKSQTKIPAIESKAIDIIKFKEYYIFVLEDCNDVLENFE